jgi:predicted nucleotidyltransferase
MLSLRSKIIRKILNLFFLNPGERFYVNELARLLKEDPSNVHKKLIELSQEGILLDEFSGKERYFFLNPGYPFLKEYKKIVLKGVGFEKILKEQLNKLKGINSAYIFGSYAQNKLSLESDIDLLVVGNVNSLKLQTSLTDIQRFSGREINSLQLTPREFTTRKKKNDPLLKDILSQKYIKII